MQFSKPFALRERRSYGHLAGVGNDRPALPKSMPETARLSVFEKENGNHCSGIGTPAAYCIRLWIPARFDSQRIGTGFCFAQTFSDLPSSAAHRGVLFLFSSLQRRCPWIDDTGSAGIRESGTGGRNGSRTALFRFRQFTADLIIHLNCFRACTPKWVPYGVRA